MKIVYVMSRDKFDINFEKINEYIKIIPLKYYLKIFQRSSPALIQAENRRAQLT